MDTKAVSKEIRTTIRPSLKKAGFETFTGRTCWRHHSDRIDVVNFQSYGSNDPGPHGTTSYSFMINLGCYFLSIPDSYGRGPKKNKKGALIPKEFECHFRGRLTRSLKQPECKSREIWYIDPEGEYLARAVTDAFEQITSKGLPWFDRFARHDDVLSLLRSGRIGMPGLWGFGNEGSPIRHYLTGYFALQMGQKALARRHLQAALESGSFSLVEDELRASVIRARNT